MSVTFALVSCSLSHFIAISVKWVTVSVDEFFSQELTRSQKHQAQREHVEEKLRQKAGLDMSVAQFREPQENDPSLQKFRKGSGKGSCFKHISL